MSWEKNYKRKNNFLSKFQITWYWILHTPDTFTLCSISWSVNGKWRTFKYLHSRGLNREYRNTLHTLYKIVSKQKLHSWQTKSSCLPIIVFRQSFLEIHSQWKELFYAIFGQLKKFLGSVKTLVNIIMFCFFFFS